MEIRHSRASSRWRSWPGPQPSARAARRAGARGLDAARTSDRTAAARDAASGLATGKRAHKPFTITKQYDKATPMLAAPSKPPAGVNQGGLLDGNAMGGSATSPAATGSPINRGGGSAGRVN